MTAIKERISVCETPLGVVLVVYLIILTLIGGWLTYAHESFPHKTFNVQFLSLVFFCFLMKKKKSKPDLFSFIFILLLYVHDFSIHKLVFFI